MTPAIVALASQYGCDGYRRITALLQRAGWRVGTDRVQRTALYARIAHLSAPWMTSQVTRPWPNAVITSRPRA